MPTVSPPRARLAAALLAGVLLAGCGLRPGSQAEDQGGERGVGAGFAAAEVVAGGLEAPWGLAFLPDGSALVSERDSGRILQLRPGAEPRAVATVPGVVAAGEGGLLGLAVSADYQRDQLVYAYHSAGGDNRIVRFRLGGAAVQVLLAGIPKAGIHNGGRIAFGPDGMLYAGTGDAGQGNAAQDPGSLGGKILRLRPDGGSPDDNPVPGSPVWSLGHRNVQGLAWDSQDRLFATEFGQNRFDEVNLIEKGGNYGWPEVEGTGGGRFRDPLVTWPTSQASPSGAAIAGNTLYAAALRGERLWSVPLDGRGGAGRPQALLDGAYGRLRNAAVAPDGALWVLTSNRDGRGDPSADDDRVLRFARVT